jgi:alpha-mannosidase
MKQSKEWLYHIDKWLSEMDRYIYREVATQEFRYFVTDIWLSYDVAMQGSFDPISTGIQWGRKWQYAWFLGHVAIPEEALGKRIELQLNLGGESTVYVNGKLAGAIDFQHSGITLTREASTNQTFEILAEVYAGHDHELPVFGKSRIVAVNEELYQFYIDLKVLFQLRNGLPHESLRVSEIDRGFMKLLSAIDWHADEEEWNRHIELGREILRPLLDCINGSTVPKLFMMGQSHLDIAWLWPIEETKRKIVRTFSNQLALLEEYPEYRYVQSQPYLFQLCKELYPELYARIKKHAIAGRVIPEGGMWVEPDTNIPSGESLIRQFLYGKRFFREEFGVESEMLWLPDVFGYSGNLPQIMKKCGIRYFASVKMNQTYDNIADPFPYNTFIWEGIDGSEVTAHLLDYGPFPNPADVSYALMQWKDRVQKEGVSTRLVQFGYGDGGGGANRDDLEFLRRMTNLEGVPQTAIASPIEFFEDLQARGMPDARYVGELYYPAHRGTLTSQAKMKSGNRMGEFALREAEVWNVMASLHHKQPYPKEDLDENWRKLLLNQFHDILPGTSIRRVHEEAEQEFEAVRHAASVLALKAATSLIDGSKEGWTCFNSLPWVRNAIVELLAPCAGVCDSQDESLPVQIHQGKIYARVSLPAMGYVSIRPSVGIAIPNRLRVSAGCLENQWLKVMLNEFGEIASIYDKETNTEWAGGTCNQFRMYRDQTSSSDAWELDRRYADAEVQLREPARMTVAAEGPLFTAIRVERVLNNSVVIQEIRLEDGGRKVEFHTRIDWKEKHKLLKVGFNVNLHTNELLSEIQFGYVKRPNHDSRQHDADRYEVCQHKWSAMVEGNRCFSLLNDSKYGVNARGKQLNLTLLRAPTFPDENADEGWHEFKYAFHIWNHGFVNNPIIQEAYEMNCSPFAVLGTASKPFGLIKCNCDNIIIDTVKMAENVSEDWVARLYEAKGMTTTCAVSLGIPATKAVEMDMLEEKVLQELYVAGKTNELTLTLKPFEVKTIRFSTSN